MRAAAFVKHVDKLASEMETTDAQQARREVYLEAASAMVFLGVVQPDDMDYFSVEDVFAFGLLLNARTVRAKLTGVLWARWTARLASRTTQLVKQAIQEVKKDQPIRQWNADVAAGRMTRILNDETQKETTESMHALGVMVGMSGQKPFETTRQLRTLPTC